MHSKTNIPFFETKEEKGRGSRPGQQTTYKNDVISSKIYISVLKTRGGAVRQKMKSLVSTTKGGKSTTLIQRRPC